MNVIEVVVLNDDQKQSIYDLWNNEYPAQLRFADIGEFDSYLLRQTLTKHYFAIEDDGKIVGWAFLFERDSEKWFANIVSSSHQGRGIGVKLLNEIKSCESNLNGWVIDHDKYLKFNGDKYVSPLNFYLKNNFKLKEEIRLELETISAINICWTKVQK